MCRDGILIDVSTDRLVLREYLRVSRDDSGEERSPNEQHADHVEDAEFNDFKLHPEPYRDIGSASRFKIKARGDFDQLLADLRSGAFDAGGLCLWEGSRGSRDIGEWSAMLDLLAAGGLRVWLHTHERLYDPRKPRDRKTLLTEAVDAEYESGMTSVRNRRTARRQAEKGAPTGRTPFGYKRIYEINGSGKRKLVDQVPHETEAPLVRELFRRIIAGESIWAIAVDWKARGVTTRSGKPFSHTHLRALATTASYGGWRVHAPGFTGRRTLDIDGGAYVRATWKGLVPEKDFLKVNEILTDPGRVNWRPGGTRHLLAGIALCGVCRVAMTVTNVRGKPHYRCNAGHVLMLKVSLEKYVTARLIAYLAREDLHSELATGEEQTNTELSTIEDALAVAEHDLTDLRRKVKARKLSLEFAADVEPAMIAERDRLLARRRELVTPVQLRDLIEPGPDVAKRWDALGISAQRTICRTLLVPAWLGELRVMASPRRGRAAILRPVEASERVVLARGSSTE